MCEVMSVSVYAVCVRGNTSKLETTERATHCMSNPIDKRKKTACPKVRENEKVIVRGPEGPVARVMRSRGCRARGGRRS